MIADLVQNRPLFKAAPGGDKPNGGYTVLPGLVGRIHDGGQVVQAEAGRVSLIRGELRAESAVFGAAAGFDVHDGTEVDFVALEMLANAVGPGEQAENISAGFKIEKPLALISGECMARENFLGKLTDPGWRLDCFGGVNHFGAHG